MSGSRDFSRASWRVKLERAKEHLVEFEAEAGRYLNSRPYETRREHQGKIKTNMWRYVFRISKQPDPRLAAIVGDVLHNVRSALDHIFCAMLPPQQRARLTAGFPVVRSSIWRDDTGRIYIEDSEERERFDNAVRGLSIDAATRLCELQPGASETPDRHPLGVLSRLENLDKHRDLISLVFVISDAESIVIRSGEVIGEPQRPGFCEDGTVVARFGFTPPRTMPPESEVRVEVHGTPQIVVHGALENTYGDLPQLLRVLVNDIPRNVMPVLEELVWK
jgi:hypothetical protein